MLRLIAGVLGLVAIAAFAWISSFPTKAECVASGRVVDPTERHCQTVNGYEQLQEHVWFHTTPVLLGAGILVAGGYVGRRYYLRRRSTKAAPTHEEALQ